MKNKTILKAKVDEQLTRRQFLTGVAIGTGVATTGVYAWTRFNRHSEPKTPVFIAKAESYDGSLEKIILAGFGELGITRELIKGKRVLLKPNLVEPHSTAPHINTHPMIVAAAIEAFKYLDAGKVTVAEGSGHRMDSLFILEMTGYQDMLRQQKTSFSDLNRAEVFLVKNRGTRTGIKYLVLPRELMENDIIVSMAKMKTHHWVGATLSMKNLFGIMPGAYYGWPKNVLHVAGIEESIIDINTTVQPHIAIVDGVVGMEGDGPIMGRPIEANVVVMGRNLPAVDATCARIMGIDPEKMPYLEAASINLGPIHYDEISQRGESIDAVGRRFLLLDEIPSQKRLKD